MISKYVNVSLQCITPQVNNQSLHRSTRSFYMISKCHFNYGDFRTRQRCEQSLQEKDLYLYQPVFSTISNETFKNHDCAVCNGEHMNSLIPWKSTLICSSKQILLKRRSFPELQSVVYKNNSFCNVVYIPPPSTQTSECVIKESYVSICNESGQWEHFDSKILNACHSGVVHVYLDCSFTFERKLYKNVFCAMCNIPDWINHLAMECISSIETFNWRAKLVSFSALIDFEANDEVEIPDKGTECSVDSLYESRVDDCLPIVCEEGMVYTDSECISIHRVIKKNNYEINLIFYPTSNHSSSSQVSSVDIFRFVKKFLLLHRLWDYLCTLWILHHPDERLWDEESYYFVANIEISVSVWHDYSNFIHHLNKRLNEIDGSIVSNFLVWHLGQSFSNYFEATMNALQCLQNPMTRDVMLKSGFYRGKVYETTVCFSTETTLTSSMIAAWSLCPRLVIDKLKFHVVISNFTLYFVDFDFYVESQYFRESDDKSQVEVCVEQYQIARRSSLKIQEFDLEEKYLSFVCTILSSFGCLATLLSHIFFQKADSLHKYNMMALSFTLLLANAVYSVSKLARSYPILCIIMGGLTQFLWLEVVSLMFMSCFLIFRTLTSWNITKTGRRPPVQLLINLACSFVVPMFCTITNILVSRFFYLDQNSGYSLSSCYISSLYLNIFTFSIPVAIMIILNIFMFLIIAREVRTKKNIAISSTKERHQLTIYLKLSSITGSTWLLGYLYQIFPLQILSYLHIIFTGSQGLFLFFSFGLPLLLNYERSKKKSTKDY
ncbi:uncharacterized protein LOC125660243 [Ostrea edulis]|uniref:uncharacterized protein LOC125660243 n=1 Tax=Ostrea edulis TaxID=37623 RepID=UPI0024AFA34B|nr:uncharacterized protein LOC125660243 [Ostrea edulis]